MDRQITAEEGGMDEMMHSVMLWNYHSCVWKVSFHLYAGVGGLCHLRATDCVAHSRIHHWVTEIKQMLLIWSSDVNMVAFVKQPDIPNPNRWIYIISIEMKVEVISSYVIIYIGEE